MLARGLALLLLALASGASAQTPDSTGVYDRVEQAPEPIGGMQAVMARAIYPPEVAQLNIQGRVFVQVVVSASGVATDARGVRCPHPELCEAAARAVLASPFEPGLADGTPVAARITLPVAFVLTAPAAQPSIPVLSPLARGQSLGRAAPEAADTDGVYEMVDVKPVLKEGLEAMQRRVRYPQRSRRAGEQEKVFVRFIVSQDGSVEHAECVRPRYERLCEAALAAVNGSQFEPGLVDGRPVAVRFTIPVEFKLH